MKAAVLYGPKDLRLCEVDIPTIGENDILLKVESAAICGTDIRMWLNGMPDGQKRILGHEMAGVIWDKGRKVTNYNIGDRVAVAPNMGCGICDLCVSGRTHMCTDYKALGINIDGAFAEYVRIPEEAVRQGNISILGDNILSEEAAIVEPLSCVFNGFESCNIRPGDVVLIIGAGPIGVMHGKLAKAAGAKVILNDLSEERLKICKEIEEDFITCSANQLKECIMKETKGRGVDVCITACPSPEVQASTLDLMAIGGRINFFGGLPKDKEIVALNTNIVHYKQIMITGTTRASLSQYRKCLSLVNEGILNISNLVTDRFSIEDIEKAFNHVANAKGMKTIIEFK